MNPSMQAANDKTTPQEPGAVPPMQTQTPANPVTNPSTTTGPVIPPTMPQEVPQAPAYAQDNLNFQAAIQTPIVGGAPATGTNAPAAIVQPQHHTSPLLKFLYIIIALLFFVAYTYLWVKIFNLPIPFLS